jgi:hypothetical protein
VRQLAETGRHFQHLPQYCFVIFHFVVLSISACNIPDNFEAKIMGKI